MLRYSKCNLFMKIISALQQKRKLPFAATRRKHTECPRNTQALYLKYSQAPYFLAKKPIPTASQSMKNEQVF